MILKNLVRSISNRKKLVENFLSLSVLQGINYLLPLLTIPYLVRVLGAGKYGLIAFSQAFIQYFVILTDFGFNLSAVRDISVHREDRQKISEIFSSIMIIKLAFMLFSMFIASGIIFTFGKFRSDWLLYYLTFGTVLGNVLFPVWFFQGMENMKYITMLNIIGKSIFTASVFIFIKHPADYIWHPFLNSMGAFITGIISVFVVIKRFKVRIYFTPWDRILDAFKKSSEFFISRVSVSVYTSSNTFIIGIFLGNVTAGYYAAAEKIFQALQYIYQPLNDVMYPYMSKVKNLRFYRKVFKIATFLNLIVCAVIFVFSNKIITILYGNGYEISSNLLKIFAVLGFIIIPSIMLGYPFLAALGYPSYANRSVIIASIIHLVLLCMMIPVINVYFVASLLIVTQLIIIGYRFYGAKINHLL